MGLKDGGRTMPPVGEGSAEGAPATGGDGSGAGGGVDTGAGGDVESRRRAKPAPAAWMRDGGADGERSEAEGLRAAKAPKAASRAGEGM